MFTSIGAPEILLIIVVILVLFGADKLPEIANSVGKGMNEFKKASDNLKNEIENEKENLNDTYQSAFEDTWEYDSNDYDEDLYRDGDLYRDEDLLNEDDTSQDQDTVDKEEKDHQQNSN